MLLKLSQRLFLGIGACKCSDFMRRAVMREAGRVLGTMRPFGCRGQSSTTQTGLSALEIIQLFLTTKAKIALTVWGPQGCVLAQGSVSFVL